MNEIHNLKYELNVNSLLRRAKQAAFFVQLAFCLNYEHFVLQIFTFCYEIFCIKSFCYCFNKSTFLLSSAINIEYCIFII